MTCHFGLTEKIHMKSMVRTLRVLLFLTSSLFAQSSKDVPSVPDQKACAALVDGVDSSLSIQSAEFVRPPFNTFARGTSGPQITVNVPFCRVAGTIKPTTDSDIHFELWLPPQADWNSKFQGVGSGASRGAIEYQRIMRGLVRGYATVSSILCTRLLHVSQVEITGCRR